MLVKMFLGVLLYHTYTYTHIHVLDIYTFIYLAHTLIFKSSSKYLANKVGDACHQDFDGDGVDDRYDTCTQVKNIQSTSFIKHKLVDFAGVSSNETNPNWRIRNKVRVFVVLYNVLVRNILNRCCSVTVGILHWILIDWSQ